MDDAKLETEVALEVIKAQNKRLRAALDYAIKVIDRDSGGTAMALDKIQQIIDG